MSLQSSRFALGLKLGGLNNENSKIFTRFVEKNEGSNPASFQGVCKIDFPIVEELDQVCVLLYDVHSASGILIGELARKSVGKQSNFFPLKRYNSHI